MDISVVIVNYNVAYFLEQCVLSVKASSTNLNAEIIVVDNNSTDKSCELLSEKYPEITLIQNKKNIGFSKANNQGVAIAKGEYVLILNPDTVIAEDTLDKIFAFAKIKNNFGALGAKLIDGAGKFLPESKRGIPTPQVSFNKLFAISSKRTGKYYATHLAENENGIVDVLVGAFMFIKKSVFNEVKGFDEDYFMYGEDIDLSYKILIKGYQNYYFSETSVIHYKGESTKKDIQYLKYFHKAMKIFYKKHFKLNKVYDFFMSFGIELWFLLKYFKFKLPSEKAKQIEAVLYFGKNRKIENYFNNKTLVVSENLLNQFEEIKERIKRDHIDTLVFDNDICSNAQIIEHFEKLKNEKVSFKIHPKQTMFLIGSMSATNKGEINFIS
ncbi:MAG: glycosyltransferase family 2 protein [Lutibacter sp.]|uniref:glycosyltransferase family 2 protein n=1 Tax=Lutibacter sp. TaxID=1925666 RepID=UPI00299F2EA4|nr:glycosyltransferase family 2 protein [Lutibacter sp.]MDX1829059.1 glycosyltransferase family 2 protein [Lutibacter sp.]